MAGSGGGGRPPDKMETEHGKENVEYTSQDTGPYRVYFESKLENAKINKFMLGSELRKMEGLSKHIIDMKYVGAAKVMVFLSNFGKANQLMKDTNANSAKYRAYIPVHLVSITGVITGIPVELTEVEIMNEMESEIPVLKVYRLNKWDKDANKAVPTTRVSVTFRSSTLPDRVKVFCCPTRILPFERNIVFCNKCLRYNHKSDNCRGKPRCTKCSEVHENEEDYRQCPNEMKCLHCKSNSHKTGDFQCPEREREKKIKKVMARQNITYVEAKEQFHVPTKNQYDLLYDNIEFPEINGGVAKTNNKPQNNPLREQWQQTNRSRVPIAAAVRGGKPSNKDQQQTQPSDNKRQRTEDTAGPSRNGVGLNNREKVSEAERLKAAMARNQIEAEISRHIHAEVSKHFQTSLIGMYSNIMGVEGVSPEVQSRIKSIFSPFLNVDSIIK